MPPCLFFLWGFAHNLDPILIPHLKKSFTLTTTQSTLVDSSVFVAYFIMAMPAGFIMKRWGYKMGIIAGLLLFAIGSFLFVPAANHQSYNYFLVALFIIACGLTILETAANPYASKLGDPATATQRLNLVQSFNGLAVALAPAEATASGAGLLLFILPLAYFPVTETIWGRSLGKFVTGLIVVDKTGARPAFWRVLIRTLLRLVEVNPFLIGGIPAGICVIATKRKQRLGDLAAGTYVIPIKDLAAILNAPAADTAALFD
jgi:MFS family permease